MCFFLAFFVSDMNHTDLCPQVPCNPPFEDHLTASHPQAKLLRLLSFDNFPSLAKQATHRSKSIRSIPFGLALYVSNIVPCTDLAPWLCVCWLKEYFGTGWVGVPLPRVRGIRGSVPPGLGLGAGVPAERTWPGAGNTRCPAA